MTTAQQQRAPRGRRPAERHDELAHLSLDELRAYRQELAAEETRVSYWRRIVQARLDLARAGEVGLGGDVDRLRSVLAGVPTQSQRRALVTVVPVDDIPPLPALAHLWDRTDTLVEDLEVAEHELSGYRSALHRRIDAATSELVARYRDDPALCFGLLPVSPFAASA